MKPSIIIPFLLFFIISTTCNAQTYKFDLFGNNKPAIDKEEWKDPSKSFLSSFVLPGAGQMYNDQVYLGLGITTSELILAGFGIYWITKPAPNGVDPINNIQKKNEYENNAIVFFSIAGIIHIAQCIQAPIYSHNRNKVNQYVYENNLSVIPFITYTRNSINVGILF